MIESFANIVPMLKAFLAKMRKANAAKNKEDRDTDAKLELCFFIFIMVNHYYLYLCITNQIQLIMELYTDKKINAEQLQLLIDIANEYQKAIERGQLPALKINMPYPIPAEPFLSWLNQNMSPIAVLATLEHQVKTLTIHFEKENVQVYKRGLNNQLNCLSRIMRDKKIDPDTKQRADTLSSLLHENKTKINLLSHQINLNDPLAGAANYKDFLSHTAEIKKIHEASAQALHDFAEQHKNTPNMGAYLSEIRCDLDKDKVDLQKNAEKYQPNIKKLEKIIHEVTIISNKDIDNKLEEIITALHDANNFKPNIPRNEIDLCINNLKIQQNMLQTADNYESLKNITQTCCDELSKIQNFIEDNSKLAEFTTKFQEIDQQILGKEGLSFEFLAPEVQINPHQAANLQAQSQFKNALNNIRDSEAVQIEKTDEHRDAFNNAHKKINKLNVPDDVHDPNHAELSNIKQKLLQLSSDDQHFKLSDLESLSTSLERLSTQDDYADLEKNSNEIKSLIENSAPRNSI